MADDDVRSRVARRVSADRASMPTSALGRRARWIGGLAAAGAKSLRRTAERAVGLDAEDVDAEAALALSLGELKGPIMKIGQMLGSLDGGLPAPLRAALSALHTGAAAVDDAWVRRVLAEDLGDAGRALARAMDSSPLATGSVGQVHRAALPDATAVAIKVVHPGVATAIRRDLAAALFASRLSPPLHAMLAQVRDRLLEECDYALEARRQARFGEIFAGHATIVVPAVHAAYGSPRVLTTDLVTGRHLEAFLASSPTDAERLRAGEALFDFYVGPLFEHGLYDCDPHPGNYLFQDDGRVAFVDFGCVREFEPSFVARFAALTQAVLADDRDGARAALVDLGLDDDAADDREATWRLLRAFYGPLLHDGASPGEWRAEITARDALKSAWRARRAATSGELVFLLRTFLGLSSVLAKLGAQASWRARLEKVIVESRVIAAARGGARGPGARRDEAPSAPVVRAPEPKWDVVLVDPGESRIALIRELRELMRRDLRDLETILDSVPETLERALSRDDAEGLRQRLERTGARVEVRRAAVAW